MKHLLGERFSGGCQIQHSQSSHEFQPALGHLAFSVGDFVQHDLRSEKFVPRALQVPPIFGDLLAAACNKSRAGRATT